MNVRLAQIEDISTLSTMYREMFKEMSLLQPSYLREADQDADFIKKTIESITDQIFIAENEEGRMCGFGLVLYQSTPLYTCLIPKKLLYLCDLFVCKEARKQGVAKDLLNAIQTYAKQLEVDYIELAVLPNNQKAIQLYEKLDYQTSLQTMRLQI